jgi:hypothetical protein
MVAAAGQRSSPSARAHPHLHLEPVVEDQRAEIDSGS